MATSHLHMLPPADSGQVQREERLQRALALHSVALDIDDGVAPGSLQHTAEPGAAPLITTKIQIPPMSAGVLARERLIAQIAQQAQHTLTLVIAPAGYGKTTLLSAWARQATPPVAWVSLDKDDGVPYRFWSYVIAALDAAQPGVGVHTPPGLHTDPAAIDQTLALLINRLALAEPLTLVLDDYDVIHNDHVHRSLAWFLDHLPNTLHIVIASRTEPPLPLAHWRAADTLGELGIDALRFTYEEAATLITELTQQLPETSVVTQLVDRTEGWAVGLRLAARAARASADKAGFLREFHGGHRDIQDYLDEEIFSQIPADMQAFVLQTAILDQLCEPLCSALFEAGEESMAAGPGAAACEPQRGTLHERIPEKESYPHDMLLRVERAGLFLIPLDNERGWYRYHTLFAEAIRYRLNHLNPALAAALLQRAADWQAKQQHAHPSPAGLARPIAPQSGNLTFSTRELEVLRLLANGCANQEIARTLMISINTVKMHLQHLYDKLDAHTRVQTIVRARELGIL